MSFELIIRLTDIKVLLILLGGGASAMCGIMMFEGHKLAIIPLFLAAICVVIGLIMPTTEQYLSLQMAKENPPKTAEETLEIIKKSQIDYHHLRAEQYQKDQSGK